MAVPAICLLERGLDQNRLDYVNLLPHHFPHTNLLAVRPHTLSDQYALSRQAYNSMCIFDAQAYPTDRFSCVREKAARFSPLTDCAVCSDCGPYSESGRHGKSHGAHVRTQ